MSDARWFEIAADVEGATRHFARAVELFAPGGLDGDDLSAYMRRMAFMHAMQSGHTSLERALLRILDLLGEERPTGEEWHADLIRRAAASMPRRPALLSADIVQAANETRKFRHRATHGYDDFAEDRAAASVAAAALLSQRLPRMLAEVWAALDPD